MDKLWAPWRIKYVQGKQKKGCIFCQKPRQKNDKKNYIIERRKYAFSILNIYPYNNGHIMVAPYKHIADLERLTATELKEMMELLIDTKKTLKKKLNPHGFNIGINLGKVAGAGIDKHLHIHLVPRWEGDTNFVPIISNTKIISQSLDELYHILKT